MAPSTYNNPSLEVAVLEEGDASLGWLARPPTALSNLCWGTAPGVDCDAVIGPFGGSLSCVDVFADLTLLYEDKSHKLSKPMVCSGKGIISLSQATASEKRGVIQFNPDTPMLPSFSEPLGTKAPVLSGTG